jgi:2-methylcitrate dehydratase PrpD
MSTFDESLASYVAQGSPARLPAVAVEAARQLIRDCVGVALAGSREPVVTTLVDLARVEGAAPVCTVAGQALRTSAAWAALITGTAAHALDFDDGQQPSSTHPSAATVPALLALAEREGLTGLDVITAYLYGLEVMTALGLVMNPGHYTAGWHATATLGTLGAAAASAKLFGLDADQIRHCLGIAASHAHGLRRNFGTMVKPLHAGTAARDGLMAAELAARGVVAGDEVVGGERGLVALMGGSPERRAAALAVLDHSFGASLPGLHIKQFPSCGVTHAPIGAALRLRAEHAIRPEEITEVNVSVHPRLPGILLTHPARTGLEAKFSIESCLALAFADGFVNITQFSDERVLAPDVRRLSERVIVTVDPSMGEPATWEAVLQIRLESGQVLTTETGQARGKWRAVRLDENELTEKFRGCARYGGLPPERTEAALAILGRLESTSSMAALGRLIAKEEV